VWGAGPQVGPNSLKSSAQLYSGNQLNLIRVGSAVVYMGTNLIDRLCLVKDFRQSRGQRYPLWLVLLLVIMGTILTNAMRRLAHDLDAIFLLFEALA
jgi:hypothetical protein